MGRAKNSPWRNLPAPRDSHLWWPRQQVEDAAGPFQSQDANMSASFVWGPDNVQTCDQRGPALGGIQAAQETLETVGAVFVRAAVGHGARGLHCGRHGVGILSF